MSGSYTVIGEVSTPDGKVRKFYISGYNAEAIANDTRDAITALVSDHAS